MPSKNPFYLIREFTHCVSLLWRDKLGQISLATTTLFWGAGATLKFIVLAWAAKALGYDLSQASYLQGVVAVGIALGAVLAARFVSLRNAVNVLPIGTAMGLVVITMIFVTQLPVAILLMIVIGACAGFFVVPMNALLQHRGHVLMGAGHSIAVQNFNENIGILVMVGLYALMIQQGVSVNRAVVLFGLFMSERDAARHVAPPAQPEQGRLAAPHRRRGRAQALGHWRLENDRRVGNLVAPRTGARRMLRQQRRDLADSLLDAFGKAAGAERRLDLAADRLPRGVADTRVDAPIGDDFHRVIGEQHVQQDAIVGLGVPDSQQAEHFERARARPHPGARRSPEAAPPRRQSRPARHGAFRLRRWRARCDPDPPRRNARWTSRRDR